MDQKVSFRGQAIPEVIKPTTVVDKDSQQVISEFLQMPNDQRSRITIEAVHYEDGALSSLRLSNKDVISTETAIALARANLLSGYSTGRTMRGGYTLRSKPDPRNEEFKGIHELPQF